MRWKKHFCFGKVTKAGANIANTPTSDLTFHTLCPDLILAHCTAKMSTVLRTLRNLRRIGFKVCLTPDFDRDELIC